MKGNAAIFAIRRCVSPVAAAALATIFLSACYVYVPVDLGSRNPPSGERVRLSLGTEASRRISAGAGHIMSQLEGRLVATSADSVRVAVLMVRRPGLAVEPMRQVFSVAKSEVLEIRRAQLSRQRTILLGAGVIAALAFTISRVSAGEGGGTRAPPPSFPEAPSLIPDAAIIR